MKRLAWYIAIIFLPLTFAFAVNDPWYEQFQTGFSYDLSKSGSLFTNEWGASGGYADKDMLGDIGYSNLASTVSYAVFSVNANNNELLFRTSTDVTARRFYAIEAFPRLDQSNNSSTASLLSTSSSIASAGTFQSIYKYFVLQPTENNYTGKMDIKVPASTNTSGRKIHVDFLVVLPAISNPDDLAVANDYITSFTVTVALYNASDVLITSQTYTYLLTGYYLETASSSEYSFSVTPTSLAGYYALDGTYTNTYSDIATISFYTPTARSAPVTNVANLKYAISLGSTSSYNASSNTFQFVNTRDSSQTIPYSVQLVADSTTSALYPGSVTGSTAYASYKNTSALVTGTTASTNVSTVDGSDHMFVIVPQSNAGTGPGGTFSHYSYGGTVQIKLTSDAIANIGNRSAGLYQTNIYVFVVSRL